MARQQGPVRRRLAAGLGRSSFHCAGCSKEFRGHRAMNAHHMAKHAGRWASASARKAARSMGKEADRARRHALGWLEAAGLREWRAVPVRDKDGKPRTGRNGSALTRDVPVKTDHARTRPVLRGRVSTGQLRQAHRHDRTQPAARTR